MKAWLLPALGTLAMTLPALAQPTSPAPDRWSRERPAQDGISEMQRERQRTGEPWVPQQNRESRVGDEVASQVEGSRGWLTEAQRAVRRGQMGQANEFLERAETRMLTRSTEPALAGEPLRDSMVSHISAARQALGRRDRREAERQIEMALQAVR